MTSERYIYYKQVFKIRSKYAYLRFEWACSDVLLIQMGDVIDKGVDSIKLLRLFEWLDVSGEENGNKLIRIMGDHEYLRYYPSPDDFTYGNDNLAKKEIFERGGEFHTYFNTLKMAVRVNGDIYVHGALNYENIQEHLKNSNSNVEETLKSLNDYWFDNIMLYTDNNNIYIYNEAIKTEILNELELLKYEQLTYVQNVNKYMYGNIVHTIVSRLYNAPFMKFIAQYHLQKRNEVYYKTLATHCNSVQTAITKLDANRMFVGHFAVMFYGSYVTFCENKGNNHVVIATDVSISDGEYLDHNRDTVYGKILNNSLLNSKITNNNDLLYPNRQISMFEITSNNSIRPIVQNVIQRSIRDINGEPTFVSV
eukprot:GHVR01031814.1.p1 GENE.GHVR01031814.1~~GHVR01031814.1.p1  ORF type:complete len:411 (-),score=60.43 GHVR01031814.1:339-1436(-)